MVVSGVGVHVVTVVTRASSSIGRATCAALAAAGHRVIPIPSMPSDPRGAIAAILAAEGAIDAVVHIGAAPATLVDEREAFLRHAWAPFQLARQASRDMFSRRRGAIVLVSASRAQLARSPTGAAADRALGALASVLRESLRGDGVRVALVDVGGAWRRSVRDGVGEAQLAREITRVLDASLRPDRRAARRPSTDVTDTFVREPAAAEASRTPATADPHGGLATEQTAPSRVAAPPARPTSETWSAVFRDDDLRLDDLATAVDALEVSAEEEIACEDESAFDEDTDVVYETAWLVRDGLPPHALVDAVTRVGRGSENELQVPDDAKISRRHFLIERRGRSYVLEDDNSGNGTLVDGLPVLSARLAGGEWISAGDSRFLFTYERPPELSRGAVAVQLPDDDPGARRS